MWKGLGECIDRDVAGRCIRLVHAVIAAVVQSNSVTGWGSDCSPRPVARA